MLLGMDALGIIDEFGIVEFGIIELLGMTLVLGGMPALVIIGSP